MPSFSNNPLSNWWKRLLQINQSTNTGVDGYPRTVQSGDGTDSALKIGTTQVTVKAINADEETSTAFNVYSNLAGQNVFLVNPQLKRVYAGESQVDATTLYKEMGLYEFSPLGSGYHYPVIANRVGMQGAETLEGDNLWGNGADPATTLDVSELTDPENAVAVYWYLDNDIYIDGARFMAISDSNVTLNFHLFSYTLDNSSNFGDLSAGAVAVSGTVSSVAGGVKTGTMTVNSATQDAGTVIVGFVENATSATDFSVNFNIRYHIR